MRDRFITTDFELDLSEIEVTYSEDNPRFKDSFFTKYSFPFNFYIDKDIRSKIGSYDHINVFNLKKKYEGTHVLDGKAQIATLEILEVEGKRVKAQIDSGFEKLPSFDKKLSELPLENKKVTDIYAHANLIVNQNYPATNYNFPQVIYKEHDADETGWEVFDQFLNRRVNGVFLNNQEHQPNTDIQGNRNIIHPMPYLLHVLKVGFQDAGYNLTGEILEDEDFKQRVIYSGKDYHLLAKQEEIKVIIANTEHESLSTYNGKPHGLFNKTFTVDDAGKWLLSGTIKAKAPETSWNCKIVVNGVTYFDRTLYRGSKDYTIEIPIDVYSSETTNIEFIVNSIITDDNIIDLALRMKAKHAENGEVIPTIYNLNEVNLKRAVPDLTFGDLVKIVKNWKNYDMYIQGQSVIMDILKKEDTHNLVDISEYIVEDPIRTISTKKSFNITFPEIDDYEIDSIFINDEGVKVNGVPLEETNEIQINGYCMPNAWYRGTYTADIKGNASGVLSLIHYDGLTNGNNVATEKKGLMPVEVIQYWKDWYKMRIDTTEYRFFFFAKKNKFRNIDIRDTLYAYNQKLWIKSISKTSLNSQMYKVEIVLESLR